MSTLTRFWSRIDVTQHPADLPALAAFPGAFNFDFPPTPFVGNPDKAPVILLSMNPSYGEGTAVEFPSDEDREQHYRMIRGETDQLPDRLSPYYRSRRAWPWLSKGLLAFVNAVPYRARYLCREAAESLTSRRVAQLWAESELLPQARAGQRFVFVHRNGQWNLAQSWACPTILFSAPPREWCSPLPYLETWRRAEVWLRQRRLV